MSRRHRRGERAWKHELTNGSGVGSGVERHYLPFNGTTNVGLALNSITVASQTTAIVLKLADRAGLGDNYPRLACLLDGASTPVVAAIYQNPSANFQPGGYTTNGTTGALLGNCVANTTDTADMQVVATRYKADATQRVDVYAIKAGATLATVGAAAGEARTPLHVVVGAQRTQAGVAFDFAAIKLVAALAIDNPTEAELQAYSLTRDARTVWPAARIYDYFAASSLVAASIPNLGVSAVPLTMSGTLASLVAL